MENNVELKNKIMKFSEDEGADVIGFSSVDRWNEADEVPIDFRPQSIWEPAKTVIVLGVGMPLPIVETTPSILHKETYDAANRVLDDMAFNLVRFLNRNGHASYFFTRDGYGSLRLLKDRPEAAFSHIFAAKYSGLGTIGLNNCLLTPEFGPRVRFVSVFTSAVLEPNKMIEQNLCINCKACEKCCPVNAIKISKDEFATKIDIVACIDKHSELTRDKAYPCGICTKVCPIGKDRLLYKEKNIMDKYLKEKESLEINPNDPKYKSWTHVRNYGSWNKEYPR